MSIRFKAVAKRNPQDIAAAPKYYPQSVIVETLDLNQIADLISDGSTLRRNDIYASIVGFVDVITKQLAESKLVTLGELGSFKVNVSGESSDTAEDLTASNIKRNKIIFRPSHKLKQNLKAVTYKKVQG